LTADKISRLSPKVETVKEQEFLDSENGKLYTEQLIKKSEQERL
jgi:hypothetical protein